MSLVSGLFTLPFGAADQAYKEARHEFTLEKKTQFGLLRISKSATGFNEILQNLPGTHIKSIMQPFLDKVGIRKDVILIEQPNLGFCGTNGTNFFKKSDAVIMIAPGFYQADKAACTWVLKHEISHIKNNDSVTIPCVSGICQLAAAIFGMCSLSFLPAVALAYTVGLVSLFAFSTWREAKADDFAIENSTDDELKGGRRFLKAVQASALEGRSTFWERITISSSGNNRLDLMHPSTTSRIQKIESALQKRGIALDEAGEDVKLARMKDFYSSKKREVEHEVQAAGGTFGIMQKHFS